MKLHMALCRILLLAHCYLIMHNLTKFSSFKTKLYADEKYLCLVENDLKQLGHLVNNELMKVDEWMRPNKLSVNCSKSMCFLREK